MPELGDVAAEEERDGPVGDDTRASAMSSGQLVEVVRPRDEPAEEAAEAEAEDVGDPLVAAERRHLAEHPVAVGLRVAARGSSRAGAPGASACWQVGGSNSPGVRRVRDAARSRRAPRRARWPSTRSVWSTSTRPRSSSGRPNSREHWGSPDAGRPDERVRRDPLAVRERRARRRPTDSSVVADADVDAALRELAAPRTRRAASGSRGGSSARRRRAPSAAVACAEPRVVAQRVADEVGELGERLDACVAGADEDEREVPLATCGSVGRVAPPRAGAGRGCARWIASARSS